MSNFGSAEARDGAYTASARGYPAPATHDEAPNHHPATYPGNRVQQDTVNNDNLEHHAPALPIGRLPLDPMSSLLRSLAFICFMLFGAACMYALVTPYWYSSKTATDSGTVLSPFFACVRSPGNEFSCKALTLGESRIVILSSGCATSADDTAMWMFIIRACVLVAGGAAAITAVIIIINLAVYPVAKAPLAITSIVGGGISSLAWAAAVATTVIGISDRLVCGGGLCGTDTSCSEFWMSAAWVLFISGAFTVAGFAVVLIDYILRVMKKPKGAVPPLHHQQPAPSQVNGATSQYHHQSNAYPAQGAQQSNGAAPYPVTPQQQGGEQHPRPIGDTVGQSTANYHQTYPSYGNEHEQQQGHELEEVAPESEEPAADGSQFHHEGFELPEGDWVWDPASNMYWSESQYLFLNPQNSQFYDPNSNKWYNPETETWYDEGEQ